jgi:hypothetical protein
MKKFIQSQLVEIVFSILFLTISVLLNLQFLEGANINQAIAGHDEYLTIREVYSILNPLSWKHFILAIIGGDILYYGRVMFYTDAFFAWLPFKIWGLSGMVFAIRMIHSLWILISFLIMNHLFIKKKFNQFLFLFGSFGVMYSLYYIQLPKPEPLQLFFIVMFLRGLFKNNYLPNKYFIWLGLAFAVKINILLILPFVFLIPFYIHIKLGLQKLVLLKFKMLLWFFVGFFTGIPCLLLTPIQPVFLQTYLHKTIFGTRKTYDDSNLGFIEWLESGLGGHYIGSHFLAYIFILLALTIVIYTIYKYLKSRDSRFFKVFIILSIGLILMLSVMFLTKRLWPHYLWTGFVLIWLSLIYFSELEIQVIFKKILFYFILLFFGFSIFTFFNKVLPEFLKREITNENIKLKSDSKHLYQYLEANEKYKEIGLDGTVYFPYRHFIHESPYHPFATERPKTATQIFKLHSDHPSKIWDNSDAVVFYKYHPSLDRCNQTNEEYLYPNEKELYELFLNKTQTVFQKDTTIGVYQVYKRIKPL